MQIGMQKITSCCLEAMGRAPGKHLGIRRGKTTLLNLCAILKFLTKSIPFTLKPKQAWLLLGNVDCPNEGTQASSLPRHRIRAKIAQAFVGAARLLQTRRPVVGLQLDLEVIAAHETFHATLSL